jgi:integrase
MIERRSKRSFTYRFPIGFLSSFFQSLEDIADGTIGRMPRSIVIGTVAEFATRRLAMRALSERLRALNSGSQRPQAMRTLKDFVERFRADGLGTRCAPDTQVRNTKALQIHAWRSFNSAFGEGRLPDIPREAILTFPAAQLRGGLARGTVHHIRCALSKVSGTAEEWGYISDNPVRKTRLPRRECNPERPVVTPQQVKRLIAALREPAKSIALLLVLTRLRIGELLALRWKNVNLDDKVLHVTESVYEGHFDKPKNEAECPCNSIVSRSTLNPFHFVPRWVRT